MQPGEICIYGGQEADEVESINFMWLIRKVLTLFTKKGVVLQSFVLPVMNRHARTLGDPCLEDTAAEVELKVERSRCGIPM